MKKSKGVLYILYDFGSPITYLDELRTSIQSLRQHCDLPITVYTNEESLDLGDNFKEVTITQKEIENMPTDESINSGDLLKELKRGHSYPKLYYFKDLPYDTTIFLDVDTLVLADPSKLISKDYDLAICREVRYKKGQHSRLQKAFNSGFFIANKSEGYNRLIDKALEIMKRDGLKSDQLSINKAFDYVYDINVRLLPQKWNVRGKTKPPIPWEDHKIRHWRKGIK